MRPADKIVVCFGEIMIESIFKLSEDPPLNTTTIVMNYDDKVVFGGAAINVCWYLGSLQDFVCLIAPISEEHVSGLVEELSNVNVDLSDLNITNGKTDHLITFLSGKGHRSIYQLGEIPDDLERTWLIKASTADIIILNGGRHKDIRSAYKEICKSNRPGQTIAFNPSYAIYEYSESDLLDLLTRCDICILNESEYNFAKGKLRSQEINYMPRIALIVTKAEKGATLFSNKSTWDFASLLVRDGVFLGAGDACLAGFISGYIDNLSIMDCLQRGLKVSALVVDGNTIRVKTSRHEIL